ncbi:heparan-alpha-glucosaminide N-acetyltransferase domain-containing protein [Flagellimonas myxillae]|uniref:heparan-alpha-glucosaminide N-acetyltransferase domain-containing protein n=1 Tax=Flagellimonas myxillae TaxID=2942214 RepID=UPI00201F5EB7|nr:DUF5009 domain-containing protein [Muricauda myxillae]MCL6266559.1 DUF5009 domain-containing protein [Muricauda myxillae]
MGNRIQTIDVLRALTMFLMIFVNDLWSLTGVPDWLKHTAADEDGMGFSDIIFPLFLFIVGLSIPLAINIRFQKKETVAKISWHVLVRTLALLVMGVFMVNFESIYDKAMIMNKSIWEIIMALAIFLIWMHYKRNPKISKVHENVLKGVGVLLLIFLAWIYKGGSAEETIWMRTHWWGILGLIGWAYLLNSFLYLFLRKRGVLLLVAFVILLFMNVQESGYFEMLPSFKIVISASNHVLVMGGVLCTVLYLKFKEQGRGIISFLGIISVMGMVFLAYGFLIRPEFPISKILATPSWTAICIGIGLLSYVLLYLLVDILGYSKWAKPIKPAGTSTLTCYLMPYFIYPVIILIGFQWPEFLSHGIVGIVKSLLFSFLIILFVGFLEKRNLTLKI